MSTGNGTKKRVRVQFTDGSAVDCRYADGVGFTQFGAFEISHPQRIDGSDVPTNTVVMVPWLPGGSNVRYVIIQEEVLQPSAKTPMQ